MPKTLRILSLTLLLAFAFSTSLSAEELYGKVLSVSGERVSISLDGSKLPLPGDRVQISEEVPGLGALPLQGSWSVTAVSSSSVTAESDGEAAEPQPGHRVVIFSERPTTPGELKKDVRTSYEEGMNYMYGRNGIAQDYNKAFERFMDAAERGYAPAQMKIGYLYSAGKGVERDYKASFEWARKAANQGSAGGLYNVGWAYYYGKGAPQDRTEATKWFMKAAEKGHTKAEAKLGVAYYNGFGVDQDYVEAARWYTKAADGGHSESQCLLGIMYSEGKGVLRDYAEARRRFEQGAEQGNLCSQKQLGFLYWNGNGVAKDNDEAYRWFRKAADKGDPAGERLVGFCYEHGLGVSKDALKARNWYQKAADHGDQMAKEYLAKMGTSATSSAPRTTPPSASAVPSGAASYVAQLRSSDGRSQQQGAKQLYRSAYKNDPAVLKAVEAALLNGYNADLGNGAHVDAMAWLCNILGDSRERTYAATLQKVAKESRNAKIVKYARKNYKQLR